MPTHFHVLSPSYHHHDHYQAPAWMRHSVSWLRQRHLRAPAAPAALPSALAAAAPAPLSSSSPAPLPAAAPGAPSSRRRLRCLRGAYHASRAVAQLLLPLLQPHQRHLGYTAVTNTLQQLANGLAGCPDSLQHEGPLQDTHLTALRDVATDACVSEVRRALFDGALCPRAAPTTALLWTPDSVQRYHQALLRSRQARLDEGPAFNGYEHLAETGVITRTVLCADAAAPHVRAGWAALIDRYTAFLPDRSHIHELENLPQEIAIGELLRDAVDCVRSAQASSAAAAAAAAPFALDCVVDVGGGNGFLAAQVAERLGCDGVVVDPFFPAHAIDCCPRLWPDTAHRTRPATRRQRTLHRTAALFRDVSWSAAVPAAPSRTALIAKHLCGSGVDEVLRRLDEQACLPRILVLAPCCFNKITYEQYCDRAYLREVMGIASEPALSRVHRLTDWNMSCYQSTQELLLAHQEAARRGQPMPPIDSAACTGVGCAGQCCRGGHVASPLCYQRRSGPRSIANSLTCTHAFAQLVEGLLNHGRVQWLQRRDYDVQLMQYVPDVVIPKNKCLLAVRRAHPVSAGS